ncbi:MAG: hypothetical protein QXJ28_00485 [Candidatus Pacearchaeota archaeon]
MIKEKRAQFYLMASIIIMVVIFSIFAFTNRSFTKKSSSKTYELSKELNLEGESVINYGLFNRENLEDLLRDFTERYAQYVGDTLSEIYFVYGDSNELNLVTYSYSESGSISINTGDSSYSIPISSRQIYRSETIPISPGQTQVTIMVSGQPYIMNLNPGQNFYFIIRQPKHNQDE